MSLNLSKSEKNGLALLSSTDMHVYSIGVSTAGLAEICTVLENPERQLFYDFNRTKQAPLVDTLIELVAVKAP